MESGSNHFLNLFLFVSATIAYMFSIGEFFSYRRTRKQTLLGIIFFGTAYILTHFYLISTSKIKDFRFLYLTELPVIAALGVYLDEYFLTVVNGTVRSFKRIILKLMPAILLLTVVLSWNCLHTLEYLNKENYSFDNRPKWMIILSTSIYLIFLIKILLRLTSQISWRTLKHNSTLKIGLIIVIFCICISTNAIRTILFGGLISYQISGVVIGFFLFFLYILRQAVPDFFLEVRKVVAEEKKAKISQIAKLNLDELRKKLIVLYEKEKIYQDEKLSLRDLAEKMDLTSHQLSEFLNSDVKLSFYNYTNHYRIKEAMEIIEKEPERSFLAIAYDVGFGSKSSFNEAFKKETGLSPREYREKILKKRPS